MDFLPNQVDFSVLDEQMNESRRKEQARKVHLASNTHRFTRIAFDLFREDASNSLWQLEHDADTNEDWLVRSDIADTTLSDVEPEENTGWTATAHGEGQFVTLSYQGSPVALFPGQRFGFKPKEANMFCAHLMQKIASQEFIQRLVKVLPQERKASLQQQHPELFRIV